MRRRLALAYCEMTNRDVEYISLSRDSSEADLKQRREIRSSSTIFEDQCAVRAATEGRVLILEGIEKAERNVLPVLNNLLENREMQLEDGRFLMSAQRYDELLQTYTQADMDKRNLVRVDERFRVIALGLPVPRFPGNPLDPPLRSRFQARDIRPLNHAQLSRLLSDSHGSAVCVGPVLWRGVRDERLPAAPAAPGEQGGGRGQLHVALCLCARAGSTGCGGGSSVVVLRRLSGAEAAAPLLTVYLHEWLPQAARHARDTRVGVVDRLADQQHQRE